MQAWFNAARSRKPQTFAIGKVPGLTDAVAALDTTGGAAGECDFCHWETKTAEDVFGRKEACSTVLFALHALAHRLASNGHVHAAGLM